MAKYFETLYKYQVNAGMTTAAMNARLKHIDDRLDALENGQGPVPTHTHTFADRIGIFLPGQLASDDLGPHIMVDGAMTVKTVRAACRIAGHSVSVVVDVEKSTDNGTTWASILATVITLESGERTSTTATTQPVVDSTKAALTAGNLIRVKVLTADAGLVDLTVTIKSDIATSA